MIRRYQVHACIEQRCLLRRQVLRVFKGRQWAHIDGHLQDMLGKHAAETGAFGAASLHFAGALACRDAHPKRQRHLLAQFLGTIPKLSSEEASTVLMTQAQSLPGRPTSRHAPDCRGVQQEDLAAHLPLPEIDMDNVNAVVDDAFTFSNAEARSQPASVWKGPTDALLAGSHWMALNSSCCMRACPLSAQYGVPSVSCPVSLLPGQDSTTAEGGQSGGHTLVEGEQGGLDIDVHNPLALDLHVSQLRAVPDAASAGFFKVRQCSRHQKRLSAAVPGGVAQEVVPMTVQAEEENIVLRAGERVRVRLRFCGLRPGKITILGLRWMIEDAAVGFKSLQSTWSQSSSRWGVDAESRSIVVSLYIHAKSAAF